MWFRTRSRNNQLTYDILSIDLCIDTDIWNTDIKLVGTEASNIPNVIHNLTLINKKIPEMEALEN